MYDKSAELVHVPTQPEQTISYLGPKASGTNRILWAKQLAGHACHVIKTFRMARPNNFRRAMKLALAYDVREKPVCLEN